MTPTREQAQQWAVEAGIGYLSSGGNYASAFVHGLVQVERFAALAFAAGAASRPGPTTDSTGADVLTEEECDRLWADCHHDESGVNAMLQSAARIGAERERERAARVCEAVADDYRAREGLKFAELKTDAETGANDCAAAIRRGEG